MPNTKALSLECRQVCLYINTFPKPEVAYLIDLHSLNFFYEGHCLVDYESVDEQQCVEDKFTCLVSLLCFRTTYSHMIMLSILKAFVHRHNQYFFCVINYHAHAHPNTPARVPTPQNIYIYIYIWGQVQVTPSVTLSNNITPINSF